MLLQTTDINGSKNRFDFAVMTGGCPFHQLQQDWQQYSPAAFVFEEKETLVKKDEQSDEAFGADLIALLEMWRETLAKQIQY